MEFSPKNPVTKIADKYPDKVSFVQSLGHIEFNQNRLIGIAVGFYNQISIFGWNLIDQNSFIKVKDIVVSEIDEDLLCSDYCNQTNILGVGGYLGVGYLINLTPKSAVVIDLDGPDEGKNEI